MTVDENFVVAEMNTAHFIFKGAGRNRIEARDALLSAWTLHRSRIVSQFPDRAAILPEACDMASHFPIYYFEFALNGGYRDRDRVI